MENENGEHAVNDLRVRLPLTDKRLRVARHDLRLTYVEDQDALVDEVCTEEDLQNFPYGLMLWASAVGLAEALAQESLVAGKRVLELGCGVGLAGIAARLFGGAKTVVQTDYQQDALTLAAHNAHANGASEITTRIGDWRSFPDLAPFDVVMGSDILYESTLHTTLAELLPRLVAPGGTVLLSDPLRPQSLTWMESQERENFWQIAMSSQRVVFEGDDKEIALFRLTRRV